MNLIMEADALSYVTKNDFPTARTTIWNAPDVRERDRDGKKTNYDS
jgi:hypothetical protein